MPQPTDLAAGVDHIGPPTPPDTPLAALGRILAREGADASAHTTLRQTWQHAGSRRQIYAEYRQIADHAHHQRVAALVHDLGPSHAPGTPTAATPQLGYLQIHRLTRAVRRGDAYGIDPERLLAALAKQTAGLEQLTDHYEQAAADAKREHHGQPTVRTLPEGRPTATVGIIDPDVRRALLDREELLHRTTETPAAQHHSPATIDYSIQQSSSPPEHDMGISQ